MASMLPGQARRWRSLRPPSGKGPVVYWMSRDQRLYDNWALYHAWARAREMKTPFGVLFCISPKFLGAHERHYHFMRQGLVELAEEAKRLGLPLFVLHGEPSERIPRFLKEWKTSIVVTDFDPLKIKREWRDAAMKGCDCGFEEVDAHNIVPCWVASPKQEYAASTFRPKLKRLLPDFLDHLPPSPSRFTAWPGDVPEPTIETGNRHVHDDGWKGGVSEASKAMQGFISSRLDGYADKRNDPNMEWQSDLSPFLHFGMISAQRIALAVMGSSAPERDRMAFIEELVVRRELSDNFCHYNSNYDSVNGFPAWAKDTLSSHMKDRRDYEYTEGELDGARTHDPLWNAAQIQMRKRCKMHGWLRMYWAKKILEWTPTPEEALRITIALNDRYELDGRDPNGYVGAAWSIGGVHDRPWAERPIFGKVRYMNLNGARRKFDVDRFISTMKGPK